MNIVYKTFESDGNYYVYDRSNNSILGIEKHDYDELIAVSEGVIDPVKSNFIQNAQTNGFMLENNVKEIEHPMSCHVCHYVTNHAEQLILQVTQRCNLRCEYCAFSGIYEKNRKHSNVDMSQELAKKSMDHFIRCSEETPAIHVSFYGGEPLLRFELIKFCVDYMKTNCRGKKIAFSMTTNGTLLTSDVATYLCENDFSIMISLDGSKKEHDQYRKFANGIGSFDTIITNLVRMKEETPKLVEGLSFNTVFNPEHDYEHIKNYFEENDIIGAASLFSTLVESNGFDSTTNFSDEFFFSRQYDRFLLQLNMIGELNRKYIPKVMQNQKAYVIRQYEEISMRSQLGEKAHHSGPCIPGSRRVFVNVNGDIFPCERVSEISPIMQIGNIDKGYNIDSITNLLNVGKITEDDCKNCWALLHCGICCQKADGGTTLDRNVKIQHCNDAREEVLWSLMEICILKKYDCAFELNDTINQIKA